MGYVPVFWPQRLVARLLARNFTPPPSVDFVQHVIADNATHIIIGAVDQQDRVATAGQCFRVRER